MGGKGVEAGDGIVEGASSALVGVEEVLEDPIQLGVVGDGASDEGKHVAQSPTALLGETDLAGAP